MWDASRLNGVKNSMAGTKNQMEAIRARFTAETQRIEADSTRSDSWRREMVDAARSEAFNSLAPLYRSLSEQAALVRRQSKFWENRTLLLMGQKFDQDAAKDSTIKQHYRSELAALTPDELQTIAEDARGENNLPLLWAAHLAGRRHAGEKGWEAGISVADAEIPNQVAALQAIRDCESLVAEAELVVGQTSGRLSPTRKLELARAMAQPDTNRLVGYGRDAETPVAR